MVTPKVVGSATALPNGKALIAGGQSVFGSLTTSSTDLYDPATNSFTAGPSMNEARASFASSALPGGRVLAAGGVVQGAANTNTVVRAQVYDPVANAWQPVAALPLARAAATATELPTGAIVVIGGTNDPNVAIGLSDVELFTPPDTPSAPSAVSAAASNGSATVTFAPPASDGGFPVLQYTVTASTGQTVNTPDARTVATIPGLANGRRVTFAVTATNALGTGPNSLASNGVTPTAPLSRPVTVPAPKLRLRGLSTSLRVKSFLKGIRFTVIPDRAAALQVTLLGTLNRATIARAYQLVLAAERLTSSPSRRTITLVPAKKLVGNPRRATVQLVIVATGSTGSRSTTTRQLRIRR